MTTMSNSSNMRRVATAVAAAAVIALTALAGVALAAGATLSIEVKGEYAKVGHTACHETKTNWRAFRRNSMIEFRGFLLPAPTMHYRVDIRIEKCVAGRWRAARNYYLVGQNATDHHPGRYKAFYAVKPLAPARRGHRRTVAYYRAKALVGTLVSERQYFSVQSR